MGCGLPGIQLAAGRNLTGRLPSSGGSARGGWPASPSQAAALDIHTWHLHRLWRSESWKASRVALLRSLHTSCLGSCYRADPDSADLGWGGEKEYAPLISSQVRPTPPKVMAQAPSLHREQRAGPRPLLAPRAAVPPPPRLPHLLSQVRPLVPTSLGTRGRHGGIPFTSGTQHRT